MSKPKVLEVKGYFVLSKKLIDKMNLEEIKKFNKLITEWNYLDKKFSDAEKKETRAFRKNPNDKNLPKLADEGYKYFHLSDKKTEEVRKYIKKLKLKYG